MAGNDANTVTLPIVTIRPDFATVVSEIRSGVVPFDTFWLSCYKFGEPSVHGKIKAELDDNDPRREKVSLTGEGGVALTEEQTGGGNPRYTASCPALSIQDTPIALPIREYADPQRSLGGTPQRIVAFDVSLNVSQFATGFLDGTIAIYTTHPTTQTSPSRTDDQSFLGATVMPYATSKVHLSSVTSLRFFPSSKVLLSGGADFALHILPAEVPSRDETSPPTPHRITPARSLRGHTRPITDTAIVAKGRNILSSSLDGTVRLWDVASGQQIKLLSSVRGPILQMSLGVRGQSTFAPDNSAEANALDTTDEREVETQDKLVFCSLQNGSIECFDLSSKRSVLRLSRPSGSLPSISYSADDHLLATGSSKGVVSVYDTRAGLSSTSAPLVAFKRNESSIEDLNFVKLGTGVALVIATSDGLPYVATSFGAGSVKVSKELVGIHCDAVRCIRAASDEIWIAGDDAVVRRYAA